jgi:hypothetical protein
MSTFLDLATDAATEIGSLGVGEVLSPDDAFLIMREFNRMAQEWSTERTDIFTVGSNIYALSASKSAYQIGPGAADFPTFPRPVLIQTAASIVPGTTARMPIDLFSSVEFAAIRERGLTGVFPDKLYCDYAMPFATLNFHPVPSGTIQVELFAFSVLQQIVNLTDVLNFPPGYENALKFNLAVKICSSFGMPLNPMTVQQATTGKAAIQKINAQLYAGALGTSGVLPLPSEGGPTPAVPATPPQQ